MNTRSKQLFSILVVFLLLFTSTNGALAFDSNDQSTNDSTVAMATGSSPSEIAPLDLIIGTPTWHVLQSSTPV